jgi:hypothetical protein
LLVPKWNMLKAWFFLINPIASFVFSNSSTNSPKRFRGFP